MCEGEGDGRVLDSGGGVCRECQMSESIGDFRGHEHTNKRDLPEVMQVETGGSGRRPTPESTYSPSMLFAQTDTLRAHSRRFTNAIRSMRWVGVSTYWNCLEGRVCVEIRLMIAQSKKVEIELKSSG